MRPTQAPRDLMRYLSLTPEQQRADYRARVEKAVHDNPGDANAQLHYLKLSLEDTQTDQAIRTARTIASLKAPAVLADAGRAMLERGNLRLRANCWKRPRPRDSRADWNCRWRLRLSVRRARRTG